MIKSVIKLSKKSLAILIALLMIISVMPLTPPISVEAAETVSAEIKAYVNSNYTNIGTPNGYTSDYGVQANAADGSYKTSSLKNNDKISNVLYTYGVSGNAPYSNTVDEDWTWAGLQYGPIVFMYDGEKDMACPVNFYAHRGLKNRNIRNFYPTTNGFKMVKNWNSNKKDGNTGYQTTTNNCVSYKYGDSSVNSGAIGSGLYKNWYFTNTLYCTLNLSDTTYYETITAVTYQFENGNGDRLSVEMSTSNLDGNKTYNPNIYIINYKPIKDRADKIKNAINEILNGKKPDGYYTQESVDAAYNVANLMLNADPTKVDYSKNQQDAVNTAAKAIQDAAEAANAFTGLVHEHSFTGAYVNNNDGTHKRKCEYFNICGGYSDNEDHSYTNKYTSGDTAKVECSCGHYYTLNASAYKAAVLDAKASIANSKAYSQASRDTLSNVLSEQAIAIKTAITQEAVDNCTSTIVSANQLKTKNIPAGTLVYNQYSITVNYFDENGKELAVGEEGATYKTYDAVDYGTIQNIVAPTSYDGKKYSVYKWTRDSQGNNTISGLNSSSLDVVVKGASTYYVFLKRTSVDDTKVDDNAVITLNNKSGNIADIGYVPMEQNETETKARITFDTTAGTITIGNTTLTAPIYSFYTIKGFYINGVLYSESGIDVTITKNTVIKPYYDASVTVNINREDNETFTINGENKAPYQAKWNQKVTLKSETEVYWYNDNDVLLGKGTTYSFYANSEVTIHTAPVDSVQNVDPTASIGYFDYDSTLNKVTVVNNFFVPDGMKVTEAGVILSTKNSSVDALKKQTNGIFKGGPESFTSTGNQIRISVSRTANTKFTMYALAYVVVDGQKYFANEVKTINYTPQVA